jgi:hypothetical protein
LAGVIVLAASALVIPSGTVLSLDQHLESCGSAMTLIPQGGRPVHQPGTDGGVHPTTSLRVCASIMVECKALM